MVWICNEGEITFQTVYRQMVCMYFVLSNHKKRGDQFRKTHSLSRVRRFLQFGLNIKWYKMAKADYNDYKIALQKIGKDASPHMIYIY